MTEGHQGWIFFVYNSCPRVAETKCVKGKEEQGKGQMRKGGEEERKESER